MLSGVFVPLVTPFLGTGLDEDSFAHHIEMQLAAGVSGLITGGIVGEGPTLTPAESTRLIRLAVETAAGRVPIIAMTGTNGTATTIAATCAAHEAGASAALLVTPYYNKPTQAGLFAHFEAIARAVDLPLILGNAPRRTNVALAPETINRLGQLPSIFALVDESEDAGHQRALADACAERLWRVAPDCRTPFLPGLRPPRACICAAANIAPRLCVEIWRQRLAGPAALLRNGVASLDILQHALDLEPEPAGVKYAVSLLTPTFGPALRLPLTEPGPASAAAIRVAVAALARLPLHQTSLAS
ncbi:dihydrodipicolinate synthase family protein [Ancylobacter sp. VNQ12]|uniref:dihydrodipicolinate synthase family protein n=1 Tax=Ancylobacter sp. VNQ12 TaxID=3400920 RepID=UPI003C0FD767